MEDKNEILEELELISPSLATPGRLHPFRVPDAYFEGLAASITANVKAETRISDGIADPFKVPEGYFETLSDSILYHIEAKETPLLQSINKKTVYSTPAGYFDQEIRIPLAETAPTKIVQLKGYSRAIQYVAAAMLAGVLVTGAFMFTDSKEYLKTEKSRPVSTEPTVPGDTSIADEVVILPMENELQERPVSNSVKRTPTFDKRVESLSDEEIKNYLEENVSPEPIQIIEEDAEV